MTQTLEQVIERVLDPATPVVWVAPGTTESVWTGLRPALEGNGYRVYELGSAPDYEALMRSISVAVPMPEWARPDLNALKDSLLSLEDGGPRGWAMIFRHPGPLRQQDESAFEDLLEVLELVHDIRHERHGQMFKLILPD